MILTVNIGNTHITISTYKEGALHFSGKLSASTASTADEYAIRLIHLLTLHQSSPQQIEGVMLASVVPAPYRQADLCAADADQRADHDGGPRTEKRPQAAPGPARPAGG